MPRNPSVVQPFVDIKSGVITDPWLQYLIGLGQIADVGGVVSIPHGGSGATTPAGARAAFGLGPLATQSTINLLTQVTGILPVLNGGSGTATPSLVAGTNVTVSGVWPNQTINSSNSGGSVTSVGLALPSIFSVSGTPVTGSGTLTGTLAAQAANTVFAGPASGGAVAPTFRIISSADLSDGNVGTGAIAHAANPSFTGTAVFQTISASTVGATTATIVTAHTTNFDATTATIGTATIGTLTTNTVSGGFATLLNTTNTGQLHLSGTGADNGAYILGYSTNTLDLAGGALFNGTNWIAKDTTANLLTVQGGTFGFYSDAGLTIGSTFGPTIRFGVDATGTLTNGTVPAARTTGFATVATSGSASDLGAGTLPAARLPNPSATTLGGVQSKAAVASNWLTSISTSGVPAASQPAFTDISGSATAAQGGTGQTSYTTGDLLYASGSTALSKLAAVAVGKVLRAKGTSTAPAWEQVVLTTDVTGTLPVANGGTGLTGGAWTAYTPTVTGASGLSSAAGAYEQIGKSVKCRIDIIWGTASALGSTLKVSLPVAAKLSQSIGGFREINVSGTPFFGTVDNSTGTTVDFLTAANANPIATGGRYPATFVYEAA